MSAAAGIRQRQVHANESRTGARAGSGKKATFRNISGGAAARAAAPDRAASADGI
jgi:hypothetical protein